MWLRPTRCCSSRRQRFWLSHTARAKKIATRIASKRSRISSNSLSWAAPSWAPSSSPWKCATMRSPHSSIPLPATHMSWLSCPIPPCPRKRRWWTYATHASTLRNWRIQTTLPWTITITSSTDVKLNDFPFLRFRFCWSWKTHGLLLHIEAPCAP